MTEITFYPVCPIGELPQGKRLFIEIGNEAVVIFNVDGDYFAIADVCTHDDGPLGEGDLEDHQIVCPRHGARFDIRNGKVISLPAVTGVPSYPIKVIDNIIHIGLIE